MVRRIFSFINRMLGGGPPPDPCYFNKIPVDVSPGRSELDGVGYDSDDFGYPFSRSSDPMDTASDLDNMSVNPQTGMPMTGGMSGMDVSGNAFGLESDIGKSD